jgi:hypothetical protein
VNSFFDISSYAGKEVRIGFDYAAPAGRTTPGWFIGSVKIWCDSVVKAKDVRERREVSLSEAAKIYKLQPAEPQIFSTEVASGYVIPLESTVLLDVLDISGSPVRTLVDSTLEPGFYKVYWDGKDDRSREVEEGAYFLHFKVEGFEAIQKCIYRNP